MTRDKENEKLGEQIFEICKNKSGSDISDILFAAVDCIATAHAMKSCPRDNLLAMAHSQLVVRIAIIRRLCDHA